MPALDTITIKGFRSIASIENLKLEAINVLIGPNGSGKSNFIEAFSFLHAIREGQLQDYVIKAGGADKVLYFGSKVTASIEIQISFQGGVNQYQLALAPTADDRLYPSSEKGCLHEHLGPWRLYHFHDTSPISPMKKTADVHDNHYLRQDASNLAAFLYYLRARHQTSYSLIRRTVQLVAPFFDDFLIEPQRLLRRGCQPRLFRHVVLVFRFEPSDDPR